MMSGQHSDRRQKKMDVRVDGQLYRRATTMCVGGVLRGRL